MARVLKLFFFEDQNVKIKEGYIMIENPKASIEEIKHSIQTFKSLVKYIDEIDLELFGEDTDL